MPWMRNPVTTLNERCVRVRNINCRSNAFDGECRQSRYDFSPIKVFIEPLGQIFRFPLALRLNLFHMSRGPASFSCRVMGRDATEFGRFDQTSAVNRRNTLQAIY